MVAIGLFLEDDVDVGATLSTPELVVSYCWRSDGELMIIPVISFLRSVGTCRF
jgi:hypothetical protein